MRTLQTIAFLLALLNGHAQGRSRTLTTDSGTVVLHYFTTGELSTKEWMDTQDHWGRSSAYKRSGELIFQGQTRRVAGHATVDFSYHPNGGVSKVETSDAPDGGIQWYRSTTTFDEEGNKTGHTEQGHDGRGLIPRVTVDTDQAPSPPTVAPKPTPAEQYGDQGQRLFVNEVYVVNGSRWPVEVSVEPMAPSPALQAGKYLIAPGAQQLIGSYSIGEAFVSPVKRMKVTGRATNRKGRQRAIGVLMMEDRQLGPERKVWYYHVMGTGGRVGIGF